MRRVGGLLMETVLWLFLSYLAIAAGSLLQVANGEDISYMSFWHGPAKFLVEILR